MFRFVLHKKGQSLPERLINSGMDSVTNLFNGFDNAVLDFIHILGIGNTYTASLMEPHEKKSSGVRSGVLVSMTEQRPIHQWGRRSFRNSLVSKSQSGDARSY